MLTCKEASRLLSQSQDQPLSRLKRMELRLHVWLCRHCGNFEKQLKFLRQSARRLAGDDPLKDRVRLDEAARERIKKALRR
jgi:hypothetical protein